MSLIKRNDFNIMPPSLLNTEIYNLVSRILTHDDRELFYSFSNADGKYWLLPANNMLTAMQLYQPSHWKGILMKRFFPFFKDLRFSRKVLKVESFGFVLDAQLHSLLSGLFNTTQIEFSLFCGTPSVHQKITMQIHQGRKILGYCKITDNPVIYSIFRHEQGVLSNLIQKGNKQVPECLFCDVLKENIYVFVQTTVKTDASRTLHHLSEHHWEFLEKLSSQTLHELPFEETDFYRSLCQLQAHLPYFEPEQCSLINMAISRTSEYFKDKPAVFSIYHGDFTPWNTIIENDKLFIFDWEYARLTYPPYLDAFHFFTQTRIFERKLSANNIWSEFKKAESEFNLKTGNGSLFYQWYLLATISFYVEREKGNFGQGVRQNMNIWVHLLGLLQQNDE